MYILLLDNMGKLLFKAGKYYLRKYGAYYRVLSVGYKIGIRYLN